MTKAAALKGNDMNAQELQSLRNLGNECEEAADEIERLRAQQAMLMAAHEFVKQERDALRDAQRQAVRLLDKQQSSKQVTGLTQGPVAWLAAFVNSEGLPDKYVTTHHELAVENDANGAPKPLFFHPPTTHEPMAWIDSMGHPHHLSAIQGVREKQLYGPWRPLYD